MITTFRGHVFDQYMKFSVIPAGIPHNILDQIWTRLIGEFKNPKYESQCIRKIKEIKQFSTESVQDFDQRFKNMMAKVIFQISDVQHKE